MSEMWEVRKRCEICQRTMIWNEINRYGEFTIRTNSNDENGGNQERENEEEPKERENEVREVRTRRRKICG